MVQAFPQGSVKLLQDQLDKFRKLYPKNVSTRFGLACSIAAGVGSMTYGFRDNLLLDQYSPFPHEAKEGQVAMVNCTTVIPYLYIPAELGGLNPQIVEFFDTSDEEKNRVSDYPPMDSKGHYGIIIDVGRKHKYLLDTTMARFGPILEETSTRMRIGKNGGYLPVIRTFSRAERRTPEEFAAMMRAAQEPGKSLDMLIAGQRMWFGKKTAQADCTFMVYYEDSENRLFTRMYIPQPGISDKVIFCNMYMDDEGTIKRKTLSLYTARAPNWDTLLRPRQIGEATFRELLALRRAAKTLGKNKKLRLGPLFLDASFSERSRLLEIIERIDARLPNQEHIRRQLVMRTLYEGTNPDQEFVYTQEDHDRRVIELMKEEERVRLERIPIITKTDMHKFKVRRLERRQAARLKRESDKLDRRKRRLDLEVSKLLAQKEREKEIYRRTQDMIIFAQNRTKISTAELEEEAKKQYLEPVIGRIAMIEDFARYAQAGRKDLEFRTFMDPIPSKIRARKKRVVSEE
jgi:hypothetical protein